MNEVAPRVGIVWDPTGSSKQTIRAGTGIYYDTAKLWETAHHMLNAPFGNTVDAILPTSCPGQPSKNGCPVNFLDPWSSTPGGDPLAAINYPHMREPVLLPTSNAKFPTSGVYVSMPIDAHPMKRYRWNVSCNGVPPPHAARHHLYGEREQSHLIPGYRENPVVHSGNCVPDCALTATGL
jgi:hypothetical protein